MLKKYTITLLALCASCALFAKKDATPVAFETGANVCFIGDSITHAGKYTKNIVLYYATRYPTDKINFYNTGISGDTAAYVNKRLQEDVFALKPNYATLMIGMNDTKYMKEHPCEWYRNKLEEVHQLYIKNISEIIKKCEDQKCRLIMFAPSPYDKFANIKDKPVVWGKHEELKFYSDQCRRFAYKHKLPLVDMWNYMLDVNFNMLKDNPEVSLSGYDRVHPSDVGGYVMMANFVRTLGEFREISKIEIDASKANIDATFNCDVSNLKADSTSTSFDCIEYALPFPLNKDTKHAEKYIGFANEYNQEILHVRGLQKGKYSLAIDGKVVGEYSDEELAKGVNLGNNEKTPQYAQAVEAEKLSFIFREYCNELREINATEMWQKLYELDSFEARVQRLETMLKENKIKHPYIKKCAELYKTTKPQQAQMFAKSRKLLDDIYTATQPKKHTFELKKVQ